VEARSGGQRHVSDAVSTALSQQSAQKGIVMSNMAAAPGDVLAVWTGNGLVQNLIRAGEALVGKPAVANHVVIVTHQDSMGRWMGIQGQPGGVGPADCSPYLSASQGRPLMVAPFVSKSLASILTEAGWSWADDQGNFDLRAPGLVLRQRQTDVMPAPTRRSLPRGSGSFAIISALVGFSGNEAEEPGATALAGQAGISQPRVSQVLRQLYDLELVERSGHGRWKPKRELLLDRFLAEYPGPGGSEQYYYSLDSPVDVAVRASHMSAPRRPVVASADVGADLIESWRRPSLVILYAQQVINPSDLGLIEAQGKHDGNVIVRMPDDQSVFPPTALVARVQGNHVLLADPLQQIWDLQDLGGADRLEAAGRLRQWLLARP
jgi:DNA-binding transcriptional ArsR family regulator